jgi:folate-binding protein YgfZ
VARKFVFVSTLALHDFHRDLDARFMDVSGSQAVEDYGDPLAEHGALRQSAGLLDLSFRGRLCVLGTDRQRFLNGQVTNNVKDLKTGQGCYAALVTAKGRMQSDLNIYCLENEILLDIEPGLSATVQTRLEKFIIAEDAQVADVGPHYGLLSVQGPKAAALIEQLSLGLAIPEQLMALTSAHHPALGEIYLTNRPRIGSAGFDLFVPAGSLRALAGALSAAALTLGARWCGWNALETARIEAGIPRFGADMDETNLPPEAGLDNCAISYSKGCYIGQEVIARIRTYGQVAKSLRGLRVAGDASQLPRRGDKLFQGGKEAGYVTSAVASPILKANIALAYVRREAGKSSEGLTVETSQGKFPVEIVETPFVGGPIN